MLLIKVLPNIPDVGHSEKKLLAIKVTNILKKFWGCTNHILYILGWLDAWINQNCYLQKFILTWEVRSIPKKNSCVGFQLQDFKNVAFPESGLHSLFPVS